MLCVDSIVVSIERCQRFDPGSNPGPRIKNSLRGENPMVSFETEILDE